MPFDPPRDFSRLDEAWSGTRRPCGSVARVTRSRTDPMKDVHSRMSDVHETVWGDVGLVTFVLDQTYTMDGENRTISAPTSIVLVRQNDDWKVALIHTVPIPDPE